MTGNGRPHGSGASLLAVWLCFLLVSGSVIQTVEGQQAGAAENIRAFVQRTRARRQPAKQPGTVIGSGVGRYNQDDAPATPMVPVAKPVLPPDTFRQLKPITHLTCYYDLNFGFIKGIRYTRKTADGEAISEKIGKANGMLKTHIKLPHGDTEPTYITAVNATYSDMATVRLTFMISDGTSQTCDVGNAVYMPNPNMNTVRAASLEASMTELQANLTAAVNAAAISGEYTFKNSNRKPQPLKTSFYSGPLLYGRPSGLASLYGVQDAGSRYVRNFNTRRNFHWVKCGPPPKPPPCYSCGGGGGDDGGDDDNGNDPAAGPRDTGDGTCAPSWPCRDCHLIYKHPNCCCGTTGGGGGGGGGGGVGRSPRPRRSPIPWPQPSPRPVDPDASPTPGRSPRPGESPRPGGSPGPVRVSPSPSPGQGGGDTPDPRASPSPRPRPKRSPRPRTSPQPRPSPSPRLRPSPSPKPRKPSPSPKPKASPRPVASPRPRRSPRPEPPSNFTVGFASRGQHSCVTPVSPMMHMRAYQYAVIKLSSAGFGSDYTIVMGNCTCIVDEEQMGTPIYNCGMSIGASNPDIGSPYIIADYVAMDIDTSGPWACIDEYQPFCAQPEEYPTQACGIWPMDPNYLCTIEPPPDPLPMPIIFVNEGAKCDPNYVFSTEQQAALREYVFKFTTGLGLVLTYENFTCQTGSGNAWYQATYILAAGVDVDIYTGSDNIVYGVDNQFTLCQKATAAQRPAFCKDPPLANALMCTVNQYDPDNVYRCPRAGASLAVTFAVPDCNCATSPDSASYQKNAAVWFADMMVQNGLSMVIQVPEGKCVQVNGTECHYQYRVRAVPPPNDDFADPFAATQTIDTDIGNNPQPCWPVESSAGWPFCSYWTKVTACAVAPWNPDTSLLCEILPTDGGTDPGDGGDPYG